MNVNRKDDESRQEKINSLFLNFLPSTTRKLNDSKSIIRHVALFNLEVLVASVEIEILWFLFEMCPL